MKRWTYALAALALALPAPGAGAIDGGIALPVIPPGKALLVFYRTGGIKGILLGCTVRERDDVLAHLSPGRYATAIVDPGVHQLDAAGRGAVTVTAAPDQVHYVRCRIGGALMATSAQLFASDRESFEREASSLKPSTP